MGLMGLASPFGRGVGSKRILQNGLMERFFFSRKNKSFLYSMSSDSMKKFDNSKYFSSFLMLGEN